MKDKYMITGASGFLGNVIIRELNRQGSCGDDVVALVHDDPPHPSLEGLSCKQQHLDVTDMGNLRSVFAPENYIDQEARLIVIHCAGVIEISSKRNSRVHDVDVTGTENVVEAVGVLHQLLPTKPFLVYIGSVHAIPDAPHGTVITEPPVFDSSKVEGQYAKAKAEASAYVKAAIEAGIIDGCIIMPSGIIGPYDFSPESMKRLVRLVAEGRMPAIVKGGYDFVDVRDVASGIISSCRNAKSGDSYILSGHFTTMRNLCSIVARVSGAKPPAVALPLWVAKLGVPLCEAYYRLRHEAPLFTSYALRVLGSNGDFSCGHAEDELGYTRRTLEETLADMVSWLHEEGIR